MDTNYNIAWKKFASTLAYAECIDAMSEKGIIFPYSSNILATAFAAGWGDREIKFVKQDGEVKKEKLIPAQCK